MRKGVADVLGRDSLNGVTESLDQLIDRVGTKLFDERLDFGEQMLDRIEVGRVGRQIQEFTAKAFDQRSNLFAMMDGPVVQHKNAPLRNRRQQRCFEKTEKGVLVDGVADDESLLSHHAV